MKNFKKTLKFLLAIQLALPTQLLAQNSSQSTPSLNPKDVALEGFRAKLSDKMLQNPLWEDFVSQISKMDLTIHIDPSDPIADEDPFFLRSQNWSSETQDLAPFDQSVAPQRVSYLKSSEGLKLRLNHATSNNLNSKTLQLNVPMTPLQATDDLLILSVDKGSQLFENKVGSKNNVGEGFFFLSLEELARSARSETPVGIYFFPLPGNGWVGMNQSYHFIETNQLVLKNKSGQTLPIDIDDIKNLMRLEENNRLSVIASSILRTSEVTDSSILIPAPRSTAGFGLIGLDIPPDYASSKFEKTFKYVQKLLISPAQAADEPAVNPEDITLEAQKPGVKRHIIAAAGVASSVLLWNYFDLQFTELVHTQLMRYTYILSGMFVAAIVLKYSLLKEKLSVVKHNEQIARAEARSSLAMSFTRLETMKRKLNELKSQTSNFKTSNSSERGAYQKEVQELIKFDPEFNKYFINITSKQGNINLENLKIEDIEKGLLTYEKELKQTSRRVKEPTQDSQWYRDVFSVFAHETTVLFQMPTVTMATAIQLFFDRTLPEYTAGNHKIINKILSGSIYWAKRSSSRVPVNWKTFLLGVVVLGWVVDTPFVAWQDLIFFPALAAWMSHTFSGPFVAAMHEAFVSKFSENKGTLVQGIVRSGLAWAMGGASHFAADTKAQILPKVEAEADAELSASGKNPLDPSNQKIRKKLIDDKLDRISRQRGLPSKDAFLFDLNTIFNFGFSSMGYSAPISNEIKEKKLNQNFILEARPTLAKNALRKAIRIAQQKFNENPSQDALNSIGLLKSTLKDMTLLDLNLVRNPLEKLKRARNVRKVLTLLSYEGDLRFTDHHALLDASVSVPLAWADGQNSVVVSGAGIMFRQALMSYLSKEGDEVIRSNDKTVAKFIEQADQKVRKEVQSELSELGIGIKYEQWIVENPYHYEQMLNQEILNLSEKENIQKSTAVYDHSKSDDWLARRQKSKAMEMTIKAIQMNVSDQEKFVMAGSETEKKQLFEQFRLQWKELYAINLSRTMGLYINDGTTQEILKVAHEKAELMTSSQLKGHRTVSRGLLGLGKSETIDIEAYYTNLSGFEQIKFEADLYATNFVDAYLDMTTRDAPKGDLDFKPWQDRMLSPDQPGRFQWVRQNFALAQSQFMNRMIRGVESLFEDEQYKPGVSSLLKRSIPLGGDFANATSYFLKTFVTTNTAKFMQQKTFFLLGWSWATYAWFSLIGAYFIYLPSLWLNRFSRQQGKAPLDSIRSKIAFGLMYSPATMWATIPFMLYYSKINQTFDTVIAPFFQNMYASIPEGALLGSGVLLIFSLSNRIRNFVRQKISGFHAEVPKATFFEHTNPVLRAANEEKQRLRSQKKTSVVEKSNGMVISCKPILGN